MGWGSKLVKTVTRDIGSPAKKATEAWGEARQGLTHTGMSLVDKQERDDKKAKKARQAEIAAAHAKAQMLRSLPQLEDRKGLADLGAAGQFQATTVANAEDSPWKKLALQQQGVNQGIAGDELARNNAVAAAQGRAAAAGGIGAANSNMERAGQANMQSLAMGRQGLDATGGQQRQAIAQQAGAKGLATAQFNTGQLNQANQANISSQRTDATQQNAFNQLKYGEQMKFKSGQLTGDAMAKSGGKK